MILGERLFHEGQWTRKGSVSSENRYQEATSDLDTSITSIDNPFDKVNKEVKKRNNQEITDPWRDQFTVRAIQKYDHQGIRTSDGTL